LKYLDDTAYVQVALSSDSFCTAAQTSFCLQLKSSNYFLVTPGIGIFLRFLIRVSICISNTLVGYLIIGKFEDLEAKIDNPMAILGIIFVISYILSAVFMDIYATIGLTIF